MAGRAAPTARRALLEERAKAILAGLWFEKDVKYGGSQTGVFVAVLTGRQAGGHEC